MMIFLPWNNAILTTDYVIIQIQTTLKGDLYLDIISAPEYVNLFNKTANALSKRHESWLKT